MRPPGLRGDNSTGRTDWAFDLLLSALPALIPGQGRAGTRASARWGQQGNVEMAYDNIIAEIKGKVGLVTLHRPDALNALNSALIAELGRALDDFEANEKIIRALGDIGDPRAIAALERLARVKWTLHPGRLSRMKTVLFGSLSNYPRGSIERLLRMGLQARNSRIHRLCRSLLQADGR